MDGVPIGKNKIVGITVAPSFAYLFGEAKEIVYVNAIDRTHLSELIWDMSNLFYIGGAGSLNVKNRFFLNLGLWSSISMGNGNMMDFDWIYTNNIGNPTGYNTHNGYGRNDWTNWSLSSVEVLNSKIFDVNISYDLLKSLKYKISPMIGYRYLYWDWNDKILDSVYPTSPAVLIGPPNGVNGIDYQLNLHFPYFGVKGGLYFSKINIEGVLSYSPFGFGDDHDHHILRSLHFYDRFFFGQYISFSLKSAIEFLSFFSLEIQASAEYLFEARGDTIIYSDSGAFQNKYYNSAGFQYQAITFAINALFNF